MSYALGGILLGPFYKGRSSIQAKSTVNDAIRYTWVVGKVPNINHVIKTIPEGVRYSIQDHRPTIMPYDGVHITLNYLIEVQIHTPESLAVRQNEIHHRIYRMKRYNDHISMKYDAVMENRQWKILEECYKLPAPMSLALPIEGNVNTMWEDLLDSIAIKYNLELQEV